MAGATFRGFIPEDDKRYQEGWSVNLSPFSRSGLKPPTANTPEQNSTPSAPPTPTPQDSPAQSLPAPEGLSPAALRVWPNLAPAVQEETLRALASGEMSLEELEEGLNPAPIGRRHT